MIVNSINVCENFHAIILNREIQASDVVTYDEWLDCSILPIRVKKDKHQYASISVKILLEEDTDEEVLLSISELIRLATRCRLEFSDLEWGYDAVLVTHSTKQIMKGKAELTMNFQAPVKYGPENEVIVQETSDVVTYEGTTESPCILSILPASVLSSLTITGLSEKPIIINHLEAGKEIVIDGELGKVTCEGANKFGDYDAWEFPRLLPGDNTVTMDSDICQVTITYKPLYL